MPALKISTNFPLYPSLSLSAKISGATYPYVPNLVFKRPKIGGS